MKSARIVCLFIVLLLFQSCRSETSRADNEYIYDYFQPAELVEMNQYCRKNSSCRFILTVQFQNRSGETVLGNSELSVHTAKDSKIFYHLNDPVESGICNDTCSKVNFKLKGLTKLDIVLLKNRSVLNLSKFFPPGREAVISFEEKVKDSELVSVRISQRRDLLKFIYRNGENIYYKNSYFKPDTKTVPYHNEFKKLNGKTEMPEDSEEIEIERIDPKRGLLLNLNESLYWMSLDNFELPGESAGTVKIPPLSRIKDARNSEVSSNVSAFFSFLKNFSITKLFE